ncbi:MAG: hypothetical protein ACR2NW_09725 [Thermodesulfobacteriota bacterium]
MMSVTNKLNEFDNKVVKQLKEYGKKIKKYELIQIVKRDIASSELEINQSIERLVKNKTVTKTKSNDYLLTKY